MKGFIGNLVQVDLGAAEMKTPLECAVAKRVCTAQSASRQTLTAAATATATAQSPSRQAMTFKWSHKVDLKGAFCG